MNSPVTKNPQVMHDTACFAGTRVPVKSLFDHLASGYDLNYFLSHFPSVKREQVIALLEDSSVRAEGGAEAVESSQ